MRTLSIPSLQPEAMLVEAIRPSPCTLACPAGINVKGYVSLMAEGRFADALETIRRRCPLPGVCGRICHHPCEKACRRGRYDDPVSIRSLKRFAADYAGVPRVNAPPVTRARRVAIVGSGPAGLTAAYDLRMAGFGVTVFEAAPDPGGMLRYGIADYRLPREILDAEIDVLCRSGVEILTGQSIGSKIELDDLLYRGYGATLLAVGAQRGQTVSGADDALSFLRRVKEGERTRIEGRVLVIGGGSTAIETARTALRLGAESVEILYRRYREELLADREEIDAAEAEGVRFRFLVAPKRRLASGLECIQIGLGEPDSTGRRRPIEIPGSNFVIAAQHVFAAVGQKPDTTFLPNELLPKIAGRDRLVVDEATSMTSVRGIFAAGDAVTGPATVVEAIGAGHRAAESIRHFLEEGAASIREQKPERRAPVEYELPDPEPVRSPRMHAAMTTSASDFEEVEHAFSEAEAIAEAKRCLRCGPCGECRTCTPSCTRRHLVVRSESEDMLVRAPASVATSLRADGRTRAVLDADDAAVLPVRCHVTEDRCRACGRCIDVCSFGALRLVGDDILLDPAVCRGCGLCTAVCPTGTLKIDAAVHDYRGMTGAPLIVLACQRRTGALEPHLGDAEVIRLRCVGQLDAGLLLDLQKDPSRTVLVAGCSSGRCRFTTGADHALGQIERAQAIAEVLGLDAARLVADWSPDRLHDPLTTAVEQLKGGGH